MKPAKTESEPCDECGVDTLKLLAERDTIKAKLAEYEAVHAWCDKNVDSAVFYKMMGNQWFVHNRSQKQYKSTTLYAALHKAWEARDK